MAPVRGNMRLRLADEELDMFRAIGRLPIRQLTAPHVVQAVPAIQKRGAMDIAKRCWNTSGQVLRYAVVYGHIDREPLRCA